MLIDLTVGISKLYHSFAESFNYHKRMSTPLTVGYLLNDDYNAYTASQGCVHAGRPRIARPLQIALVNFKNMLQHLLKSCSKVARSLEKLLLHLNKLLLIYR